MMIVDTSRSQLHGSRSVVRYRLSFSPHVSKIVAKASCRAKLILKYFRSRDSQLLVRAFCKFVRPLVEFSSIIWSPFTAIDINRMESVQRSFTKAIKNLRFSTYKEHLVNLCLDSLQCRLVKADLVFCYILIHGLVNINATKFFTFQPYPITWQPVQISQAKICFCS